MAGCISKSNPSKLGGGFPGGQPKGGLLGGGGGSTGGSGMVGGSERSRDRRLLRTAFGRFNVKDALFGGLFGNHNDEDYMGVGAPSPLVSGVAPVINVTDEDSNGDRLEAPAANPCSNPVHKFPLTPFRQAFNAGDSEGTVNNSVLAELYAPNQVGGIGSGQNIFSRAGGAHKGGGAAYTGNTKYVYDSSDYIRFKKLQAKNRTYNDKSFGGANNGAYVPLMRMRH